MGIIKSGIGLLVGATITGETLSAVGSGFTGSLSGIGRATQAAVAGGFLGHAVGKGKGGWL